MPSLLARSACASGAKRRVALAVLLSAGLTIPVAAQSPPPLEMPVPRAVVAQLGLETTGTSALTLSRIVRVMHSGPPLKDGPPEPIASVNRLLMDLLQVDAALARFPRATSIEMTRSSQDRSILRDILEAIGLRLRERRNQFTVEEDKDKDATALRRRLLTAGIDAAAVQAQLNGKQAAAIAPVVISLPNPLPREVWASAVFEHPVTESALFATIALDRRAALLCLGLQALSPDTRAFLAAQPDLLHHLYTDASGAFAAFGDALQVTGGRLSLAGGPAATPVWEELTGERVDRPERFARALFDKDGGRLSYFYWVVSRLDPGRQRFALALAIPDAETRIGRVRRAYQAFVDVEPQWSVNEVPFLRPASDLALMLHLVDVNVDGTFAGVRARKFWERALDGDDIPDRDDRTDLASAEVVDAGWIGEQLSLESQAERQRRIARLAFAQRLFKSVSADAQRDAFVAIRSFGRFPALMLLLEHMHIDRPATYVAVARHALAIEQVSDPDRAITLLAQFQGALALLDRLVRTGAIAPSVADRLVNSLAAQRIVEDAYRGALASWVEGELAGALPPLAGSMDARVLSAMSDTAPSQSFAWEGDTYVVDVTGTSLRSLTAARDAQQTNRLDAVLALSRDAARLTRGAGSIAGLQATVAALRTDSAAVTAARPWTGLRDEPPDLRRISDRALKLLRQIDQPKELAKAPGIVAPVVTAADYLLGETLVALAYLPAMAGSPDSTAPLIDVSHRHDFGIVSTGGVSNEIARRAAWLRPRRSDASDNGQAYVGSLFGLDLPMSPRRLRRLAANQVPPKTTLNPIDVERLVDTLALLNPRELTDESLGTLGAVVAGGRARVAAAAGDTQALDSLAAQVGASPLRRAQLSWLSIREPGAADQLFSIGEMASLGGGTESLQQFGAWGTSQESLSGCLCLGLPDQGAWDRLASRRSISLLAAAMSDLNLSVAHWMADLHVPAPLFPAVMAIATQEYIDRAAPRFDDDWAALIGFVSRLTRDDVEDYVSAVVANGPVRQGAAVESPK